ncbi:MAG TPA: CAP domain-containing protein [Acidimicrobiia bacterium]|nr:CAP domain-containing protein [Acidimicrobiia bacterium]
MLKRVTVVVVALLALVGGPLGRGAALAGQVQDLTAMTNADRMAQGLRALSTADDLQRVAQSKADEMARTKRLAHSTGLGTKVSGWQRLGENVGRGPTLQEIETAFMASPSHRQNILDAGFTQLGVGVAYDGKDYLYVAVIFRQPSGATASATPAPAPAPRPTPTTRTSSAPKPKPTTTTNAPTTTTQAPTTTTTAPPPPPPVEEIVPPVESTTTTVESTTTTTPRPITENPDFLAANFSDRIIAMAPISSAPVPGRATWPIVLAAGLGLLVGSASSAALRLELKRSRSAA